MQNKSEPNKNKALAAVILEKLFDQTKKIIKNTLSYLTIFSLVFSSALINTAYAADGDVLLIDGATADQTTVIVGGAGGRNLSSNGGNSQLDIQVNGTAVLDIGNTADLTIDTIISTDADDGAANTLDLQLNGITLTVEEAIADNENDPLSITVTDNNSVLSIVASTGDVSTTNSLKFITTTGTRIDLAAGTYSANFDGAGTLKLLGTVVNDEVIGNATTIGTLDMNSNTLDNGAALIKVGTLTLSGSILGGASLQVTGTAAIGANVTTTGDQLFQGAAIVSVDTILTNTNSDVTFSSTLNSDATPRDLTIDTGGNTGTILFSGAVGQTNNFDVITITGNLDLDADIGADDFSAAGATSIAVSGASNLGEDVTTSGTQTYTGAVTLSGGARTLKGSTVTFGSTLAGGGQNLTITGDAVFGGNATGLGALDVSGTLAANATNITATNESITIQGTTTIADGITLVVDSGTADKDITFAAITAGDAEGQNLTINAGTNANAQIFLNGDVTNLDTLSITDAGILNLVGNITVDTLVIPTAVNNVIVSGNITTTADTSFANVGTTIIGNADDDVNTFGGGLDITAGPTSATAITLQGTIKTTNDQIDIGDADTGIRIAGTATITTNGAGVINLAGAISGAGGAQNLIINSTGATTISQAVTALQNLTTDALGSTILQGNVTTSALQTYGDTVTISGDQNFTRYNSFNGFCSR